MSFKKIFVSHSGKQHVHQLLYGLQKNQIAYRFFTSFWYKAASFPFALLKYLPSKIRQKIKTELQKRGYEKIDETNVRFFPWIELVRELVDRILPYRISEYFLFYRDRTHDYWAASKLNTTFQIVVGYEECALLTFRKAKKLRLTTVLDLAQIHYKEIENIGNRFTSFSETFQNKSLRKKINIIKAEEIFLADYIICLSSFAKDSLIKHGVANEKIKVLNLGFDPDKFIPKQIFDTDNAKPLKIVFAGTITKRKGIDMLMHLIDDFGHKIHLTIIGAISDAGNLFLPYQSQITWHPYLQQQQMNEVFTANDVFVFPSYLDSWAMVVLEAMACGLPVVISDNTGAKDAVTDLCGDILKTGDYPALKSKIAYICEHRNYVKEKGLAAIDQSRKYTWEAYHQQIAQTFQNL